MLLLDILLFAAWLISCSAVVGIAAYVAGRALGEALGGPDFWRPRPPEPARYRPARYGLLLESRR